MDETFNPTLALARSDTLTALPSTSKTPTTALKQPKANTSNYPRIDLEPIYTDLKDAIGARWDSYSDALTRFTRGTLHAREFGDLTDEIIYSSDHVLHLHNKFICAIAFNSARDSPEPGVAAWVTAAADKSTSTAASKAVVTSDAGEQRLKKEVMALHARDRRRLKGTGDDKKSAEEDAQYTKRNQYEDAYAASKYKVPEVPAASIAGGLTKTNLEPEIKKRYQQPLFAESAEFPDVASVYARMVPICYEEAIPQGASMACAELAVIGAEFYFKDILSTVFDRVRVNGPRYDNGVGGGVFTSKYLKQVKKEDELIKMKKLARTREDDLLPVEAAISKERRPLSVADFKLAGRIGTPIWTRTPLLGFDIQQRVPDGEWDDWKLEQEGIRRLTNGHTVAGDAMDVDHEDNDDDFDWEAEGFGGRDNFDALMNDCLTVNAS